MVHYRLRSWGCLAAAALFLGPLSGALGADSGAPEVSVAALESDTAPVDSTIIGATATGSLAQVINALAEAVRREYPGSSLGY